MRGWRAAHPRSPSTSSGVARILAARIMKFCDQCGAAVRLRVPEGDTLPRYVCAACGTIHYQHPRLGAGAESLEVELVEPARIPWADIAFPSTDFTLRRYLEDRADGRELHHFTTIDRRLRVPAGG